MPTIEITLSAEQAVHFDGHRIVITEKAAEWVAPSLEVSLDDLVEQPVRKRPKGRPSLPQVT